MLLAPIVVVQTREGHALHQTAGPAVARLSCDPLSEASGGLLRRPCTAFQRHVTVESLSDVLLRIAITSKTRSIDLGEVPLHVAQTIWLVPIKVSQYAAARSAHPM